MTLIWEPTNIDLLSELYDQSENLLDVFFLCLPDFDLDLDKTTHKRYLTMWSIDLIHLILSSLLKT